MCPHFLLLLSLFSCPTKGNLRIRRDLSLLSVSEPDVCTCLIILKGACVCGHLQIQHYNRYCALGD